LLWHTKFQMNVSHAVLVSMSARLTQFQKVISIPSMQSFAQTVVHAQKFVRLRQLLLKNSPLSIKTLKLAHAGFFYTQTQPFSPISRLANMKNLILFNILLLGLLSACNKDIMEFSDPEYPSRYCILTDAERNDLFNDFQSDLKMNFEVDSFGFLERKDGTHRGNELFSEEINDLESVEEIIRSFVHANQKFYGISDFSQLNAEYVYSEWASYGGTLVQENENDRNRWMIRYENQVFNGIEVYDTKIGMYVSGKGVYQTYGHWYSAIHLPQKEDVSFDEAKQTLIGRKFKYYDWGGGKETVITADTFYTDDNPEMMIIPYRRGNCIEMRLCWKITSKTIWNFYVDVMNGKLVLNEQTVIF